MILSSLCTLLVALPAGDVQWEDWSPIERCHDVELAYRLSSDPWGQRIEFVLENAGSEKLAAAADLRIRWSDGGISDHVSCILGGVGGPLTPADTSVPESWAAPHRRATKEWDRSAGSPHPLTGERPTVESLEILAFLVTTETFWKSWLSAHPGASYSLRDGPNCEGREVPIGWRRVARTWNGSGDAKNRFEQRVELRDGILRSASLIRIDDEPDERVEATLRRDQIESVRVAWATPYELPIGKVVYVELRLKEGGVAVMSKADQSDPDDTLLLHFYFLSDAQACVDAIEEWRTRDG